jgi:L-ascorbate metabolism protein UlaG (beta-lactamase superfamily)
MRLTKHGHACVRLEKGDTALVVDPGEFSGENVLQGASAVLVTHEHFDHVDVEAVTAALRDDPDLTVWTTASVAEKFTEAPQDRVRTVRHGDTFEVGGVDVHVYGETHAPAFFPAPVQNIGFLIGGEVFHPGDAFTVPEEPVGTLLLPTNAPWLKATEVLDYAQTVAPRRGYSIHDGLVNEIGAKVIDRVIAGVSRVHPEGHYERILPGESVQL